MEKHTDISVNYFISILPPKLQLWAILLRLDRPIGWWLLVLPAWWIILLKSSSIYLSIKLILFFTIGSILMRGAGCIINDLWDKDIDSKVTRTLNRPIANGTISTREAFVGLSLVLLLSVFILLYLPFNSFIVALISLPLIALYPLAKRYTKFPQLALGIVFSWGVPLGWSATNTALTIDVVILYIATIAWVFGYDTIYSIQDKKDDIKLNINSTALTFDKHTRLAILLTYLFATILFLNVKSPSFWTIGVILAGIHMIWQTLKIKLNDPKIALMLFKSNRDLGLILSLFAFIDLYYLG